MQAILDRIRLTLGMAPRCDWVQSRIPSYIQWDISLTPKEFEAVDRHLGTCPKCAAEAVLVCDLPLFEKAGIAAPPKTYDEIMEDAKLLTKDTDGDGIIDQMGFVDVGHVPSGPFSANRRRSFKNLVALGERSAEAAWETLISWQIASESGSRAHGPAASDRLYVERRGD